MVSHGVHYDTHRFLSGIEVCKAMEGNSIFWGFGSGNSRLPVLA